MKREPPGSQGRMYLSGCECLCTSAYPCLIRAFTLLHLPTGSDRIFRVYTRPDAANTGRSENWSLGLPRFCCQVLVLVERSTDTSSLLIEHIAVHGPVSPSKCSHKENQTLENRICRCSSEKHRQVFPCSYGRPYAAQTSLNARMTYIRTYQELRVFRALR
jgi:hypothetical protein